MARENGALRGEQRQVREPPPPPAPRSLFWPELQTRPRPTYVVKGFIDDGCFAEIFGPSQSGKSFFATDLGLHVAAGWEWRGFRVRQGGVLYVSAEGGAAIINRLDAWSRHHNQRLDDVAFAVVLEPTNVLEDAGVAQVVADASRVPDLVLIVIDTAARVMPGSDEGAEDMSAFVAACDRIRAECRCAVLIVHHTGKDASRGSRGHSLLPAALDAAGEMKRDAAGGPSTFTIVKARDGETGRTVAFRLEKIELGTDDDGDPIFSCVVVESEAAAKGEGPNLTANQASMFTILKAAAAGGLPVEEWNTRARTEGLGVKRRTDLMDFREALRRKKLVHEYDGRWFAAQ